MSIGTFPGSRLTLKAASDPGPVLEVGQVLETEFSALHAMARANVEALVAQGTFGGVQILGTTFGIDPNAPSGFVEDYIRDKWEKASAIELAMNTEFYNRGETTRVRLLEVRLLESAPAASERPELRGTHYVHRARWKLRVQLSHNALPGVAWVIIVAASAFLVLAGANAATGDKLLDFAEDVPRRIIRGIGSGVGEAAREAAVPIALIVVLLLIFFGGRS